MEKSEVPNCGLALMKRKKGDSEKGSSASVTGISPTTVPTDADSFIKKLKVFCINSGPLSSLGISITATLTGTLVFLFPSVTTNMT